MNVKTLIRIAKTLIEKETIEREEFENLTKKKRIKSPKPSRKKNKKPKELKVKIKRV